MRTSTPGGALVVIPYQPKSRFPWKVAFAVLAVAVLGWGGYSMKFRYGPPPGMGGGGAPKVTVAEAKIDTWQDTIEAIGTAKARESIEVTAQVTEVVSHVNFTDGQQIEKGDIIVSLGAAEQQAQLAEAQANLKEQQREYERTKALIAQKVAAAARMDVIESRLHQAEARVKEIRAAVGKRAITAPFSGVLGLKRISTGTLITPGTVITTLDDVSVIRLDFTVPEVYLSSLTAGLAVHAESRAFPNEFFDGVITAVDSRIEPSTRAVTVRAEIPNPDARLRPGMLLTLALETKPREALVVPEQALVPVQDKQFVYVVGADMIPVHTAVTLGARQPGKVEILSGLKPGDKVITEGTLFVQPGKKVEF